MNSRIPPYRSPESFRPADVAKQGEQSSKAQPARDQGINRSSGQPTQNLPQLTGEPPKPGFFDRFKSLFANEAQQTSFLDKIKGLFFKETQPESKEAISKTPAQEDLLTKLPDLPSPPKGRPKLKTSSQVPSETELRARLDKLGRPAAETTDAELNARLKKLREPGPNETDAELRDRLDKLREGTGVASSDAQLAQRQRELSGRSIPTLEHGLEELGARRVDPQRASVDVIRDQQGKFMQGLNRMMKELSFYSKQGVDANSKLAASNYASLIRERVKNESQYLGTAITQLEGRTDISPQQKRALTQELHKQKSQLVAAGENLLSLRFSLTKQVNEVIKRQKR